jgi:hypothetical protein
MGGTLSDDVCVHLTEFVHAFRTQKENTNNSVGSIRWFRSPSTSTTFWVPFHQDDRVFARVFSNTVWKKALGGRAVWEEFSHDLLSFFAQLSRSSFLFGPIHSQVIVLREVDGLMPYLLE